MPAAGIALILAAVTVATVVVIRDGAEKVPSPPTGVTLVRDGAPPALQKVVIAAVAGIRDRDVDGLAALDVDVDTHRRGGHKSSAGAQWLVGNFAEPLQGPVNVEIRQDENTGVQWNACLTYGTQHRLRLGFTEYGRKGFWPDPDGGGHFSFTAGAYSELVGTAPKPRTRARSFCEDGEMFAPSS